jgi:hypothetical protein
MNRKNSYVEIRCKKGAKKARTTHISTTQIYASNKNQILPPAESRNRTCGFCHKSAQFPK